jgi:hypothetical protein
VAYFLRSAEMASDDKFEEKMKVDCCHRQFSSCNIYILIFGCRTSELSSRILLLKIDLRHCFVPDVYLKIFSHASSNERAFPRVLLSYLRSYIHPLD